MKTLPPTHPGDVLLQDFIKPFKLTLYRVAKDTRIPYSRLHGIIRKIRSITPDTALRLGRYFNVSPEVWMGLQYKYDLAVLNKQSGKLIERDVGVYVPCL